MNIVPPQKQVLLADASSESKRYEVHLPTGKWIWLESAEMPKRQIFPGWGADKEPSVTASAFFSRLKFSIS